LKSRAEHLTEIKGNPSYDVIVIGGGCNGAGVALDASSRGLKTLLIEANDFGSGASSKSTKLIHGGLRYLQAVFISTDSLQKRK
jgi:glycerol-3-phosphate dehydrogenase